MQSCNVAEACTLGLLKAPSSLTLTSSSVTMWDRRTCIWIPLKKDSIQLLRLCTADHCTSIICDQNEVNIAMLEWKLNVYHNNNLATTTWKEHETTIPMVPISMRLKEYSKQYSLWNVTGLPKIYVILVQYWGHYFSVSGCQPDRIKLAVKDSPYQFSLVLFRYLV